MCLHRPFMAIYGLNADGINMLHLHHPCCASGDTKIPGKPPQIDTDCDRKQRGASVLPAMVDLVVGFQFVEPVGMNIFGTQRSHGGKSKSGNGILDYIGWTWFFFWYDLSFGTLRFNNLRVHLFALFIIIDYNNDTQIWSTAVRHQTLSFSKQGFRPLIYFFICFYRLQISQPIQTFCLSNYSKEQYYLYRLLLFFLEVWKGPKPNRSHLINDIISGIWMHMADPCAAIPVGSSQVSVSENPVFVMAEGRVYNFSAGPSAMPLEVPGFPMDSYGLHGPWLISRFQATNQL